MGNFPNKICKLLFFLIFWFDESDIFPHPTRFFAQYTIVKFYPKHNINRVVKKKGNDKKKN